MTTPASNLGLNNQQREWAKDHDWFIESFVNAYNLFTVVVRIDTPEDAKRYRVGVDPQTLVFTNFDELREWAGY